MKPKPNIAIVQLQRKNHDPLFVIFDDPEEALKLARLYDENNYFDNVVVSFPQFIFSKAEVAVKIITEVIKGEENNV